tara:strand:- start:263 stop:769 length:507 start_codon:yes stop_codon:yes gene_type:complete
MFYIKLFTITLLLCSALTQIVHLDTWWFIQNVNLIFHEAGHVFLIFFGETLYMLGGTIFEIGVPLLIALYFYFTNQKFSAIFCCWWLTTALLSVSIYVSDAQERLLPLITKDISTHDWFNILSKYNMLQHDDLIGNIFWILAIISTAMMVVIFIQDKDTKKTIKLLKK